MLTVYLRTRLVFIDQTQINDFSKRESLAIKFVSTFTFRLKGLWLVSKGNSERELLKENNRLKLSINEMVRR